MSRAWVASIGLASCAAPTFDAGEVAPNEVQILILRTGGQLRASVFEASAEPILTELDDGDELALASIELASELRPVPRLRSSEPQAGSCGRCQLPGKSGPMWLRAGDACPIPARADVRHSVFAAHEWIEAAPEATARILGEVVLDGPGPCPCALGSPLDPRELVPRAIEPDEPLAMAAAAIDDLGTVLMTAPGSVLAARVGAAPTQVDHGLGDGHLRIVFALRPRGDVSRFLLGRSQDIRVTYEILSVGPDRIVASAPVELDLGVHAVLDGAELIIAGGRIEDSSSTQFPAIAVCDEVGVCTSQRLAPPCSRSPVVSIIEGSSDRTAVLLSSGRVAIRPRPDEVFVCGAALPEVLSKDSQSLLLGDLDAAPLQVGPDVYLCLVASSAGSPGNVIARLSLEQILSASDPGATLEPEVLAFTPSAGGCAALLERGGRILMLRDDRTGVVLDSSGAREVDSTDPLTNDNPYPLITGSRSPDGSRVVFLGVAGAVFRATANEPMERVYGPAQFEPLPFQGIAVTPTGELVAALQGGVLRVVGRPDVSVANVDESDRFTELAWFRDSLLASGEGRGGAFVRRIDLDAKEASPKIAIASPMVRIVKHTSDSAIGLSRDGLLYRISESVDESVDEITGLGVDTPFLSLDAADGIAWAGATGQIVRFLEDGSHESFAVAEVLGETNESDSFEIASILVERPDSPPTSSSGACPDAPFVGIQRIHPRVGELRTDRSVEFGRIGSAETCSRGQSSPLGFCPRFDRGLGAASETLFFDGSVAIFDSGVITTKTAEQGYPFGRIARARRFRGGYFIGEAFGGLGVIETR